MTQNWVKSSWDCEPDNFKYNSANLKHQYCNKRIKREREPVFMSNFKLLDQWLKNDIPP